MTAVSFDILGHDRSGSKALNKVGSAADRTRGKFGALGNTSGKVTGLMSSGLGKLAGAMTLVAGVAVFKDFIAEARESRKVGNITANVIKTTGGVAKVSSKQVGDLAMAISNKTGIDDEAIQSGSNLLLTFKNVRNETGKGADIFNRATQAAVDLSAAGFGSITSTSKSLGKALNDPLKGLTALGKAGVTFTADQKKQIATLVKSGQTLKAQQIIMTEVESQIGGAAAAAADPMQKLGVIIDNQKEKIGTALLPVVDKLATWLGNKLPTAINTLTGWAGKIAPAFLGVGGKIKDAISSVDLGGIGADIYNGAVGWAKSIISGIKKGLDTGDWAPLGKSLGSGLISAIKNIGEGGGKIIDAIGDWLSSVDWGKLATKFSNAIKDTLKSIDWAKLGQTVGDALYTIFTTSKELVAKFTAAVKVMLAKVDWVGVGDSMTGSIIAAVEHVDWWKVSVALVKGLTVVADAPFVALRAVLKAVGLFVVGIFSGLNRELDRMSANNWSIYRRIGADIVDGLKAGASAAAKGIGGWLKKTLVDPVVGWAKSGFGVHSPSTVFFAIGKDIVAGLKGGIVAAARGIGTWIYRTVIVPVVKPFASAGTWLVSHGRNLIGGFKNGILAIGRTIGRFVYANVIQPTVRAFTTAGTWLVSHGRNLIGGFKNGILAIGRTIGRFVYTNVVQPVVRVFANSPGTWLLKAGQKVIGGFSAGMRSVWGGVTKWVGGIATWIKTHKGPVSLDGRLLIPAGKAIMSGFLTGLKSGAGKAWDFVTKIGGKSKEAVASAYGWLKGIGWSVPDIGTTSLTGPMTRGVEQWRGIALKALAAAGAPASWIGSLLRRMNQESGGNQFAINNWDVNAKRGDPSRGLMQTIGGTFRAYAGQYAGRGIYDPFANIYASIKYANARYGAAPRGWDRAGGYRLGTPWVPNDQLAFLHKGEAIVPAEVNRHRVTSMGAGGNGSVSLRVDSSGSRMDDFLAEMIRRYVRVNGGNVQRVFGDAN